MARFNPETNIVDRMFPNAVGPRSRREADEADARRRKEHQESMDEMRRDIADMHERSASWGRAK